MSALRRIAVGQTRARRIQTQKSGNPAFDELWDGALMNECSSDILIPLKTKGDVQFPFGLASSYVVAAKG
jgi:hypothetical protein